jgi:hypothetical protein
VEPNNYVGFDRVSEITGISITRKVEQLCQVGQFSNALIFFAINCRRKHNFTHKLKANTFHIKMKLKFSNHRYKPIPNNKNNLILSFTKKKSKQIICSFLHFTKVQKVENYCIILGILQWRIQDFVI